MKKKNGSVLQAESKNYTLLKLFIYIFCLCGFLCVVMGIASSGYTWKSMLFHKSIYTDWFMDFYNSIRDAATANVYSERNNIYPPLAILFFRIISLMLPESIVNTTFDERYYLQTNQLCIMVYLIYAIVICAFIYRVVSKYARNRNIGIAGEICGFIAVVSFPVIYCLERGNITIAAMAFSMFFIFFRNSESKGIRECAYILLAVAAGIKYYPAIFGLLLIVDKKYKDAAKLVLYGVLALIIPFLVLKIVPAPITTNSALLEKSNESSVVYYKSTYGETKDTNTSNEISYVLAVEEQNDIYDENSDTEEKQEIEEASESSVSSVSNEMDDEVSVSGIISNIFAFTQKKGATLNLSSVSVKNIFLFFDKIANVFEYYSIAHEGEAIGSIMEIGQKIFSIGWGNAAVAVCIFTEIIALCCLFIAETDWQKVFLLVYLFLNIAVFSSSYALMFVIIPMFMLIFKKKKPTKLEITYTVLFSLLVSPIPMFWYGINNFAYFFQKNILKMSYCSNTNQWFATPVFQALFVIVVIEIICKFVKKNKSDKNKIKTV